MGIKYKVYSELKFLVVNISQGISSHKELFNLAKSIRERKDFKDIHYTLIDLRGAQINIHGEDIKDFINLVEEYKVVDNQKSVVYIMDQPVITALIHMFVDRVGSNRKYCSTTPKAHNMLGLDINIDEFKKLIEI